MLLSVPLVLEYAMKTADFFAARAAEVDIEAARRILRRAGGQPPEPRRLPGRGSLTSGD